MLTFTFQATSSDQERSWVNLITTAGKWLVSSHTFRLNSFIVSHQNVGIRDHMGAYWYFGCCCLEAIYGIGVYTSGPQPYQPYGAEVTNSPIFNTERILKDFESLCQSNGNTKNENTWSTVVSYLCRMGWLVTWSEKAARELCTSYRCRCSCKPQRLWHRIQYRVLVFLGNLFEPPNEPLFFSVCLLLIIQYRSAIFLLKSLVSELSVLLQIEPRTILPHRYWLPNCLTQLQTTIFTSIFNYASLVSLLSPPFPWPFCRTGAAPSPTKLLYRPSMPDPQYWTCRRLHPNIRMHYHPRPWIHLTSTRSLPKWQRPARRVPRHVVRHTAWVVGLVQSDQSVLSTF